MAADAELPKLVECRDGGQVFVRRLSGRRETLFTCRAGAALGHRRYAAGEWSGYGHSDPCHGSFLLAQHSAFLVCGPGPVYRRDTALHNTITIDGRGQIGDSLPWAPEFVPLHRMARTRPVIAGDKAICIEHDLAAAYLPHLDVLACTRRFYLIEPDILVVHDRISLSQPHQIQWNLHTRAVVDILSEQPLLQLKLSLGQESLRLLCLSPAKISLRSGFSEFVPAYPNGGEPDRFVQLYATDVQKEYIIVVAPEDTGAEWFLNQDDGTAGSHLALTVDGSRIELW